MKDIHTILGEIGITVPEDKKQPSTPQFARIIRRYRGMTSRKRLSVKKPTGF